MKITGTALKLGAFSTVLLFFTAAVIVGAYVYKLTALDFLATVSGVVFLFKCSQAINSELEERQRMLKAEREAQRILGGTRDADD